MKSHKSLCKLSLTYGTLSDSSWIEARKSQDGFSIFQWAEEIIPTPITIGNKKEKYNWRIFANFLMRLSDGFVVNDAWRAIKVSGESGLRADCLRIAWSYNYEHNNVLDWLLLQSEESINFLESHFKIIDNTDDYQKIEELSELISFVGCNDDILHLFNYYGLASSRNSIDTLKSILEDVEDNKENQQARIRNQALEPFRFKIDNIANMYSDDSRRIGAGISGSKPSMRTIVRSWLESYVIAHGFMPEGKHSVSIPFFGGSVNAGEIDFSNLPEEEK